MLLARQGTLVAYIRHSYYEYASTFAVDSVYFRTRLEPVTAVTPHLDLSVCILIHGRTHTHMVSLTKV